MLFTESNPPIERPEKSTTPRSDFPHVIDNSMRSAFVACEQRFFRSYVQGWTPDTKNVDLHAGAAFAVGIETARRAFYGHGHSISESIAEGYEAVIRAYGDYVPTIPTTKTVDRVASALLAYFEAWPLDSDIIRPLTNFDGSPTVEFHFTIPLPEVLHPQTHEPILYYGRFDMLAEHIGTGAIYIVDEKTTSSLGPTWAKKWDLSSQFTGYVWGARQFNYDVRGAIIRGVSILKTKHETLQAVTLRPEWAIDRWYKQLIADINRMIIAWQSGQWNFNLADSCAFCAFRNVCLSSEPDLVLADGFAVSEYAPSYLILPPKNT